MAPSGFARIDLVGKRVHYVVLPNTEGRPVRTLYTRAEVLTYLEQQQSRGLLLGVQAEGFDFIKAAMKRGPTEEPEKATDPKLPKLAEVFAEASDDDSDLDEEEPLEEMINKLDCSEDDDDVEEDIAQSVFKMQNLMKNVNVKLDHKEELTKAGDLLHEFMNNKATEVSEEKIQELKQKIMMQTSIEGMVETLGTDDEGLVQMSKFIEDATLQELLMLNLAEGEQPLSDWPNQINQNWFSETLKFAMKHSPITVRGIASLVMKDKTNAGINVNTKNVVNVATIYAQLAQQVDVHNNALQKMQALQFEMDHMSDTGINAQAKLALSVGSTAVGRMRDDLAEVAERVLLVQADGRPRRKTWDNCDFREQHIMVSIISMIN